MLSAANGYSSMYESSLVKLEAPFEAAANLWGENMRLIIRIYGYLSHSESRCTSQARARGSTTGYRKYGETLKMCF